jgi:hypothetical protein
MRKLAIVCALAATASAGPKPQAPPPPAPTPTPAPPPPEPAGPPKPWAVGVPQDVQDKASALYEEGNQLFAQQAHAPALEKYRAAIALWDHPLIRFNMAVTEIRLDRVLEAADDLDKALRYGDQPFTKDNYQSALDYKKLLDGRVGYVEASCDQAGAHLLLDGRPWFDCPGKQKQRVLAGEHAVVGEKTGMLTSSQKLVVAGGATASGKIALVSLDSAVVLHYPYRRWIPWTMAAVGAAIGIAGAGALIVGNSGINQFEADYATQCAAGCEPGLTAPEHRPLAEEKSSAELKQKLGVAMIGAGGAVAITGLVLAILNRPTRVLPNVEVAPHAGGVTASVGWHF